MTDYPIPAPACWSKQRLHRVTHDDIVDTIPLDTTQRYPRRMRADYEPSAIGIDGPPEQPQRGLLAWLRGLAA